MARPVFFQVRVAILSAILLLVLAFAWRDVARRNARNAWQEPLDVGIVLLTVAGQEPVPSATLARLSQRVNILESTLCAEFERYRSAPEPMFRFSVYGPVNAPLPPAPPASDSLWDSVVHTYRLWRYTREIDAQADVPARALESRIYVATAPARDSGPKFVEGFSQQGGHFGFANVELDASTVDLSLFVVAHELMHTLGASDKYDSQGYAQIPQGLADAHQTPLYPQRFAEVMARNRVLSPGNETVPDSLSELRVGAVTAREIGWLSEQ